MGGGYGMETEEIMGVIPRVIRDMYQRIEENPEFDFTVKVSYLEVQLPFWRFLVMLIMLIAYGVHSSHWFKIPSYSRTHLQRPPHWS